MMLLASVVLSLKGNMFSVRDDMLTVLNQEQGIFINSQIGTKLKATRSRPQLEKAEKEPRVGMWTSEVHKTGVLQKEDREYTWSYPAGFGSTIAGYGSLETYDLYPKNNSECALCFGSGSYLREMEAIHIWHPGAEPILLLCSIFQSQGDH